MRDAVGELEVVVEAVLDRRSDRDLDARVELHHRGREHVRGVVADQLEGLRPVICGEDRDVRAVGQRAREIAHLGPSPVRRRARPRRRSIAERGAREPGPIAAAASAPVAPSGSSSGLPSGSVTVTDIVSAGGYPAAIAPAARSAQREPSGAAQASLPERVVGERLARARRRRRQLDQRALGGVAVRQLVVLREDRGDLRR